MEDQKKCSLMVQSHCMEKVTDIMSHTKTNQLHLYLVKLTPSPNEVKKEEAQKLYQLMNISMYHIIQEIDMRKKDEFQISNKLMWFSKDLKYAAHELMYLERPIGEVKPHLPMRPIPRAAGFLQLTEKDAESPVHVGTDRKRCHKRLKKERIDFEYLKQVQEELLSSLKSDKRPIHGAQELNDVMESLVHRIQHGSNNREEEKKFFHEIKNLKETIDDYTAPTEPDPQSIWRRYNYIVGGSRRQLIEKQAMQHRIKTQLSKIDDKKSYQKELAAKVTRLKAELELVRKNIRSMEKELEKLNLRRIKAYKCAYKHGEQTEVVSSSANKSYGEYPSFKTNVKELGHKEDLMGTKACLS